MRTRPSRDSARTALSAPTGEAVNQTSRPPGAQAIPSRLAHSSDTATRLPSRSRIATSPRSSSRIGCSAIARWLPSGDRRTRLTLATRATTRPTGNSTRYPSSPERTTAKSEPPLAQSAATTPLRTSFGGPPDSGARASTPPRRKATSPEEETAATVASRISSARESPGSEPATCRPRRPPSHEPEYTTWPSGPKRAALTDPRWNVMRWKAGGSAGGERREESHSRAAIAAAARTSAAASGHHARARATGGVAGRGGAGESVRGSAAPGARGSTGTGRGHSRTVAGAVTCSTAPPTHR